jgi:hypothetical protein
MRVKPFTNDPIQRSSYGAWLSTSLSTCQFCTLTCRHASVDVDIDNRCHRAWPSHRLHLTQTRPAAEAPRDGDHDSCTVHEVTHECRRPPSGTSQRSCALTKPRRVSAERTDTDPSLSGTPQIRTDTRRISFPSSARASLRGHLHARGSPYAGRDTKGTGQSRKHQSNTGKGAVNDDGAAAWRTRCPIPALHLEQ